MSVMARSSGGDCTARGATSPTRAQRRGSRLLDARPARRDDVDLRRAIAGTLARHARQTGDSGGRAVCREALAIDGISTATTAAILDGQLGALADRGRTLDDADGGSPRPSPTIGRPGAARARC